MYALSTCGWCRKTKKLLEGRGVEFRYVDVDLLDPKEKSEVMEDLERWNPRRSFPTLVFDDDRVVVGFKPDEIERQLNHG
jgi:glutaredoxin